MALILRLILVLCLALAPLNGAPAAACAEAPRACCCGDDAGVCDCCAPASEAPQPLVLTAPAPDFLLALAPVAPLVGPHRGGSTPSGLIFSAADPRESPRELRVKHCIWLV